MMNATASSIKKMSPQLLVADIQRSIGFYTKTLGFSLDFRFEDFYCGILKDSFSIHLKSGHPSMEEINKRRNYEDADIIFSVDGIEDFMKKYPLKQWISSNL